MFIHTFTAVLLGSSAASQNLNTERLSLPVKIYLSDWYYLN